MVIAKALESRCCIGDKARDTYSLHVIVTAFSNQLAGQHSIPLRGNLKPYQPPYIVDEMEITAPATVIAAAPRHHFSQGNYSIKPRSVIPDGGLAETIRGTE